MSGRPCGGVAASESWYATCHMCAKRMAAQFPNPKENRTIETKRQHKGATVSVSSQTSLNHLDLHATRACIPCSSGNPDIRKQPSDLQTSEKRDRQGHVSHNTGRLDSQHRLARHAADPSADPCMLRQRQHSDPQTGQSASDTAFKELQISQDDEENCSSLLLSIEDSALHDRTNIDTGPPGNQLMIDSLLREVCCVSRKLWCS
jgi:hypothetical protein